MKATIDGVFVETAGEDISTGEIKEYIAYLRERNKKKILDSVSIVVDGDYVDLRYRFVPMKFERLRRITGYLTADVRTWNDAKQAEERDRVKHI